MKKLLVALPLLLLIACESGPPSADDEQRAQQQALSKQSNAQIGMPGITNFTEKRMMKKIIELRDQALTTYTYVPNMQGQLFHVCDSIGYGLPYATQYTNPQYIAEGRHEVGYAILPQADPTGLFTPAAAEGTWVACINEAKKDYDVVYVEPRIVVSPFKLRATAEWQITGAQAAERDASHADKFHGMDGGTPR